MEAGRRVHIEVEGDRFLPITFIGLPLGEAELAEALAVLHDALPPRLAAHDGKAPGAPEALRGDTLECVVKLLPADPSYSVVVRAADQRYRPLQHVGIRVVCHVAALRGGANGPATAMQRMAPVMSRADSAVGPP
ncbi:hypothetical protein KFE25_009548 [Diacronema lutheri]|uniref:Uncharacterized protein n=1 Tax=Diacronema lutheri TaxID=2081491 RepID=A0A8J6CDL4_DIALT|nr:hypothetical protein KFE25_009548 [Diacronema lutheri]